MAHKNTAVQLYFILSLTCRLIRMVETGRLKSSAVASYLNFLNQRHCGYYWPPNKPRSPPTASPQLYRVRAGEHFIGSAGSPSHSSWRPPMSRGWYNEFDFVRKYSQKYLHHVITSQNLLPGLLHILMHQQHIQCTWKRRQKSRQLVTTSSHSCKRLVLASRTASRWSVPLVRLRRRQLRRLRALGSTEVARCPVDLDRNEESCVIQFSKVLL